MNKVLIAGGTGLIGRHLTRKLLDSGYTVHILSRSKRQSTADNLHYFVWDINKTFIDSQAFDGVKFVINLAGSGIGAQRWTESYKRVIVKSRVNGTRLLFEHIKSLNISIDKYIAASAIGYYGTTTADRIFTEEDAPGHDFLAEVTQAWEQEALLFETIGIKTVLMRTGVVFDRSGGAFPKIYKPVQSRMGAVLGSGQQMIPWIHIDDMVYAYVFMLEQDLAGTYNIVAPNPVNNKVLTHTIAKILHRTIWLPRIPGFVLKLILGEQAMLALEGCAVSSEKLSRAGFSFKYPQLEEALQDLLKPH
ncbi:MAG: TIGR01777 family protein [Flavobacteriia bacterium]|nr:MAG: TIGR01777 family protein [Flavobacteriia bacterium]